MLIVAESFTLHVTTLHSINSMHPQGNVFSKLHCVQSSKQGCAMCINCCSI